MSITSKIEAITVAEYLFRRLTEAGVRSVFWGPGDHYPGLVDAIASTREATRIGTATEQGAVNAAGMYARLRGIGAAVTSAGAGLRCQRAAEERTAAASAPLVHIAGAPARAAQPRRWPARLDPQGRPDHRDASTTAIAAEADLRPGTAAAEIDRVLGIALRTHRPVSITIADDVARAKVPSAERPLAAVGLVVDRDRTGDAPVIVGLAGSGDVGERAQMPFGAPAGASPVVLRAASPKELAAALREADVQAGRPILIEDVLQPDDVPSAPRELTVANSAAR